jgi:hypothetical protein
MIPGGTANVWASEVGIPTSPVKAALCVVNSETRKVDVGHHLPALRDVLLSSNFAFLKPQTLLGTPWDLDPRISDQMFSQL